MYASVILAPQMLGSLPLQGVMNDAVILGVLVSVLVACLTVCYSSAVLRCPEPLLLFLTCTVGL